MNSIRVKLVILVLVIALPPLVLVAWFDQRATRQLGLELANRVRMGLEGSAEDRLRDAVRYAAATLRAERRRFELAAEHQAGEIVRALGPDPSLGELAPLLESLRVRNAPEALWQRVRLADGTAAVFPANGTASDEDGWYRAAINSAGPVWMPPRLDVASGQHVLRVSRALRDDTGTAVGATAIDVPLVAALAAADSEELAAAHALLVAPAPRDQGQGLRRIAERRDGRISAEAGWVEAGAGLERVVSDMAEGRVGVRRLDHAGVDSLWGYGTVDDHGTHLLFILPYARVVAQAADAQAHVLERIAHQRQVTWLSLAFFLPAVMGLALIAARAVTRPVSQLADAARRLAAGDFSARTDIRSGDELEELGEQFNVMVPRLREHMRMREALSLAMEVQQNLLPGAPPSVAGFDIAGLSRYCDETGGDYYDFFELSDLGPGRVAVAVGDVAGHGIAAALLMATARALLRSTTPAPGRLAGLMDEINRHLARDAHAGRFMTLFFAVLEAESRTISWVSAGHDPAIVYDPQSDSFQEITGVDIPLGIEAGWRYHELQQRGWGTGTVMVIGTDGIREARNPEDEMFGAARLCRVIHDNAAAEATAIALAVIEALADFRGERPQEDDVTLVVVKATGADSTA